MLAATAPSSCVVRVQQTCCACLEAYAYMGKVRQANQQHKARGDHAPMDDSLVQCAACLKRSDREMWYKWPVISGYDDWCGPCCASVDVESCLVFVGDDTSATAARAGAAGGGDAVAGAVATGSPGPQRMPVAAAVEEAERLLRHGAEQAGYDVGETRVLTYSRQLPCTRLSGGAGSGAGHDASTERPVLIVIHHNNGRGHVGAQTGAAAVTLQGPDTASPALCAAVQEICEARGWVCNRGTGEPV